ncbi:MAG: glutathione S-transferase family protein [Thermoplasmata archaeon]|nr:glutathione S-transferase family protein [Thermoplasmata archaeon]
MALPQLYYHPISHYCVSAERILAFKGIRYRLVVEPYHDRRRLLKATGQDYLPAWVEGTRVVTWDRMADHLERRTPAPSLYPDGQRALARALENWGHQVLEERVWRYVVTSVPAVLEGEVERWVFEEMQARARGSWEQLRQRRPEYRREMHGYLRMLEEILTDRPWLLGEPSLADFGVFGSISPLLTVGERVPRSMPQLADWTERIAAIPRTAQ